MHVDPAHGGRLVGIARNRNVVLCHPATKDTARKPAGCDVVFDARWGGSWRCAPKTGVDPRTDWSDGAGSRLEIQCVAGEMMIPFVDAAEFVAGTSV